MSQESKTPRTDAEDAKYASISKVWYVPADFARQLERELAAVTDERDALIASARIKEANSGWRPIKTAPKDATPIDLWRSQWNERAVNMRRVELSAENVFYEAVESGPSCVRDATHWMPIPTPPTTEPDQ